MLSDCRHRPPWALDLRTGPDFTSLQTECFEDWLAWAVQRRASRLSLQQGERDLERHYRVTELEDKLGAAQSFQRAVEGFLKAERSWASSTRSPADAASGSRGPAPLDPSVGNRERELCLAGALAHAERRSSVARGGYVNPFAVA